MSGERERQTKKRNIPAQKKERFLLFVLHAHNRRAGNYIGLLSIIVLLLSTGRKLLILLQCQ